jgi:enoyl-CoA hydratase/carnithine racemase
MIGTRLAKDAVNQAYELSLSEGIKYEKRVFYGSFATEDQKEGMNAFINKAKPKFIGK